MNTPLRPKGKPLILFPVCGAGIDRPVVRKVFVCVLLVGLLLALEMFSKALPCALADAQRALQLYEEANATLKEIQAGGGRAHQREPWEKLVRSLEAVVKEDPGGSRVPAARFRMGVAMQELGRRSFRRSDYESAVKYYLEVVAKHPRHVLADDALLAVAHIQAERLSSTGAAREALNRLIKEYPGGDMAPEARAMLKDLDTDRAVVAGSPASGAGVPPPESRSPAPPSQIYQISWVADNDTATITIDLSRTTSWRYQYIPPDAASGRPPRLYVEFDDARPDEPVRPGATISGAMFTRVRLEQPTSSRCRVVLDFTSLRRYRVTALEKPSRIVVEASRTDAGLPRGLLAETRSISEPVREGNTPARPPVNLAEQLGLTVKTIMIDPGHGGRDPGTVHNGIVERATVLKVANLLAERLRKQGFTVLMTRTKDEFVSLDRRTELANEKKADLFISIHINANNDSRVCGFETYYLDYARTSSASAVSTRENAASGKSLNEIQSILTDLVGHSKTQESLSLATLIQENALSSLRKKNFTAFDNGVRSALFLVLIGAQMPAVLLELGYCSNPEEAKRLNSDAYLASMADGIVQGIRAYRDELNRMR